MRQLLEEIEGDLDKPFSSIVDGTFDAPDEDVTTLEAITAGGVRLLLVEWHINEHTGYDGTATQGATIVRLTKELAETAFKRAKEQHEADHG